ncbi:hypothetical protein RFW48_12295, partial [Acinetobacter baumannii]|nr:hypothetical protein [Acinetobacter baumannii]
NNNITALEGQELTNNMGNTRAIPVHVVHPGLTRVTSKQGTTRRKPKETQSTKGLQNWHRKPR